jgi:hypothetical protein
VRRNQGRNLFAIQQAPLRQLSPHGAAHHRSNARQTLPQIFPGAPHGTLLDHLIQVRIQPRQFGAPPAPLALDPLPDPRGGAIQAMLFGPLHRPHVAAPRQVGRQLLRLCIGNHLQGRPDAFRKAGQPLGIQCVVFAHWPVALAQARTWRGCTTITGKAASTSPRSRSRSKPPGASTTINVGGRWLSGAITVVIPVASYATLSGSPDGRTATSSRTFETLIPTKTEGVCFPASLVKPVLVLMWAQWLQQRFGLGLTGT